MMMRDYPSQEVINRLQELIDVPVILYQECIEEGMSEEEAIEETYNRFFDM